MDSQTKRLLKLVKDMSRDERQILLRQLFIYKNVKGITLEKAEEIAKRQTEEITNG